MSAVDRGMDAAMHASLLADGMRSAAARIADRVHMEVWPVPGIARHQLARIAPDARQLGQDIAFAHAKLAGAPALADAARAAQQLATDLRDASQVRTRGGIRQLLERTTAVADALDSAALTAGVDDSRFAPVAARVHELMQGGADMDQAAARELRRTLPPGPLGPRSAELLGMPSVENLQLVRDALPSLVRRTALDAVRERVGLVALAMADDPAAHDRLRSLALDVVDADPATLPRSGWARLGMLLEADPAGRILDGPRQLDGAARGLVDTVRRGAAVDQPRSTSVSQRYFAAWRDALRAHPTASGAALEPAGIDLGSLRMLRTTPSQRPEWIGDLQSGTLARIRTAMPAARGELELLRSSTSDPSLRKIADEALKVVAENEKRLARELVDTYAGHPDYADLGKVVAAHDLLASLARPIDTAPVAEAAAASTTSTAAAGGIVQW